MRNKFLLDDEVFPVKVCFKEKMGTLVMISQQIKVFNP